MRHWFRIFIVISMFIGLFSTASVKPTEAQTPPPSFEPERPEPCRPGEPCENDTRDREVLPGEVPESVITAVGDTDDYGYTLSTTALNWIEISGDGINSGLSNTIYQTGAITMPFNFPFYENTYNKLYISRYGYLTFNDDGWGGYGWPIPYEQRPNNLIIPIGGGFNYNSGAVYYKAFGTTHFVIQWNNVQDSNGRVYTFEVILFPDGRIDFRYKTMPDTSQGYRCSSSGIENATGTDGLAFWQGCERPAASNTKVRFTRPGPSARVGVLPLYLGEFAYSKDVDEFIFTVTNTGDLGADTFDMDVTTSPMGMGWSATLHDADSGVPLTDTDSDGKVDTGSLAVAASRRVLARVSAPVGLAVGARNTTYVDVTSSRNTAKTKMVTIESTVPAPFAQTYRDQTSSKLSSDLNWPTKQMEVEVSNEAWNANQPAIVETLNNRFVHAWVDYQWGETSQGWVLRYAVTDKYGAIIKAATNLTNPPADSNYSSDISEPALAVAGDGRIGVIWTKRLYYSPDGTYNMNVYFAILNTSGGIVQAPVNLTNNTAYGSYNNGNRIQFYYPNISASSARFFLTWEKYSQATGKEDVYYAVRQSTGAEVVAQTALTASVAGSSYYYEPKQIQLTDNRFMVIYYHQYFNGQYYYRDELYKLLNSSGAVLTQEADWGFQLPEDGIQLSGGNILLVSRWNTGIKYQLRSGTNYSVLYESPELTHPSGIAGYDTISVTKDTNNRGIITWSDENNRYLYYAYVQGTNGTLLSGPVIFHRSENNFNLGYTGGNATTNSWVLPGSDLTASFTGDSFGSTPGAAANLGIQYKNSQYETALNPTLVVTLPTGLSYVSDTSGLTPTVIANKITWNLPDLPQNVSGGFRLFLKVDGAVPVPSLLDLSLSIATPSNEPNTANNTDTAKVLVGHQAFIPMTRE